MSEERNTLLVMRLLRQRMQKVWILAFSILYAASLMSAEKSASDASSGTRSAGTEQDAGQKPDFSFGSPRGFLGIRIGKFFPRAQSDIFDMITSQLTIDKNDFRAWDLGIDGGVNLRDRIDLVFSLDYMRRSKDSMFREFVDENDLPITQTTRYEQLPMTGGVRLLLVPRGRSVGKLAWLPSRVVPYIGGGAGIQWYRLEQEGDFVDELTFEIFRARLESSGWTPTAYAGGGVDINIVKSVFLTLDLRYSWARPELKRDFVSFDKMDLSGLRATGGVQWHF